VAVTVVVVEVAVVVVVDVSVAVVSVSVVRVWEVVVLVVYVLVVVVQRPSVNDAVLPSHPRHTWSRVVVAAVRVYCPGAHGVIGVHSLSEPPA